MFKVAFYWQYSFKCFMSNEDYVNIKAKQKLKSFNFFDFFYFAMVLAKKQRTAWSLNNNFPPSARAAILSNLHQTLTQ